MLHELRFYEIAAGKLEDYCNHAGTVAVPFRGDRYGKLLGFWSCEIGAVNCVFNLWEHESVATREALRAELSQQDVWRNDYLPHSQPLMRKQFSRLLKPLAPVRPPASHGNLYQFRIFRTRAGKTQQLANLVQNDLSPALRANAVGCWTGNSGDVNEVVFLSAHPQTAKAKEVMQSDDWHGFLKTHGELIEDIESSLMLPTAFSPWR